MLANPFDVGTLEHEEWERQGDHILEQEKTGWFPHGVTPEPVVSETVSETVDAPTRKSDASDTSDAGLQAQLLDRIRDGGWLDEQEFPALRYAVPGLLPEGFNILIGPPKAGKSWLILDTLLGIASGGRVLGRLRPKKARVFYLALEDGDRRMQDRCRKLLAGKKIPPLFMYQTRVTPGNTVATIEAFLDAYEDTGLVVIDTLGKVMPPATQGESAYQRDYRVGGQLKRITDERPGLSLAVLHHDRKAAAEDFVDSVSGTHGIAGAADTIVVLCRKRQSAEGLLKITGRDVPENEYALVLRDGCGWQLDGGDLADAADKARRREEAKGLSETSTEIVDFVKRAGPSGARAKDLADKFGKDVHQYLKRRVEDGHLTKVRRGLYAVPSLPVSEASDSSETQATGLFETDTESDTDETPEYSEDLV